MPASDPPILAGLGMSMIDFVQVVDSFPDGGGVTEARSSQLMGGGPVPTALCAAARLGAGTAIIDRIGDDWRGRLVRAEYESFGVDAELLQLERGRSTSFGSVLVRKSDGERHIVFSPGDFTPLGADELPMEFLEKVSILHLNGRHWPACIEAAKIVRDAGGLVSFDGGANRYEEKFYPLLPLVNFLIVARDFAEKLAGSGDRGEQLRQLRSFGAELAGITDGANGSEFLSEKGDRWRQPAFEVSQVVDTTGCGDVFHGAFLAEYLRGQHDFRKCAKFASFVAAQNATALGGRGNLVDRETTAAAGLGGG